MALKPFELVEFGGVDSRSNPTNMPQNRALRCLNWAPKQDGHLELRYGYSTESMSAVSAVAIHSLFSYQSWDATKKFLVVAQANSLSIHDLNTQTDTAATIRGAAVASSAKWGSYFAFNRLHIGNGFDQKFFDGSVFRDSGLRAPTAAEFANVVLSDGVRELNSTENTTITLTQAAGGSFSATTYSGFGFCIAIFDPTINELGPSTLQASSGRVVVTATGKKITVAVLPNLSSVNANWVKLIARTGDGTTPAYFCTNTSTAVVSCTRASTTLTVNATGHGLSTGDVVILAGTPTFDGVYSVTVTDADHFTIALNQASGNNVSGANTTGGTVKRIVSVANATTTVDVTSTAQDTSYVVNQPRGISATSVGGPNPGYQFFGCIYNATTGHVGNRLLFGGRYAPTTRTNVRIIGLPDYSGTDTEWGVMIGRTGDGAAVPYVIDDNSGNFISTASAQTAITISAAVIDTRELPTRNGIVPPQCTMFAQVADFTYAADPNSPTIRRSGSLLDADSQTFLGRPEQSWAPNDITTFPTAEAVTGIGEDDQELFAGTLNDCAVLSDQNGQPMWKGPWNVGLAGPRAMVKAQPYGFFWLSATRQLCTFISGMPSPISEEYEAAEISQIGDSYLAATELVYYRDSTIGKDEIRIEGRKQDGTPITIIHDFKLRDERSPFGQGYSAQFVSTLAQSFTVIRARDANGRPRIFAGASTGELFQLYTGADDIGTQYAADSVYLVDVGPTRPDLPFIEWIGDANTVISIGKTLSTSLDLGSEYAFDVLMPNTGQPMSVPGAEADSHWRVDLQASQLQTHLYVRFQLSSHSADGSLVLNSPPHIPLETYGRIYELMPVQGAARGK